MEIHGDLFHRVSLGLCEKLPVQWFFGQHEDAFLIIGLVADGIVPNVRFDMLRS